MSNMGSIIASHNAKILSPPPAATPAITCICNSSNPCPLGGECLTGCIVYKATVSVPTVPSEPTKIYYGLTEPEFKTRYYSHKTSFKHANKRHATELSIYMWDLQDKGMSDENKWEIAKRSTPYKCGTRRFDLCLSEKLLIASADPSSLLNKHSKLTSSCRHKNKYRYNSQIPKIHEAVPL